MVRPRGIILSTQHPDEYAASHGITFSDLVADALRRLIKRKSA